MRGNYDNHECGLEIKNFDVEKDVGMWTCEMESYVRFGGKGSGDRARQKFYIGALTTTSTSTTTPPTTTVVVTADDTALVPTTTEIPEVITENWDPPADLTDPPPQTTTEEALYVYEYLEKDFKDYDDEEYDDDEGHYNSTETMDSLDESDVQSLIIDETEPEDGSSVVAIVCGVLGALLATAAVVAGVLVWRRRRRQEGVITMSKILEDTEARGAILEETEVTHTQPKARHYLIFSFSITPPAPL